MPIITRQPAITLVNHLNVSSSQAAKWRREEMRGKRELIGKHVDWARISVTRPHFTLIRWTNWRLHCLLSIVCVATWWQLKHNKLFVS